MTSTPNIRAGVAAWLGVLFCLVFTLNTVGGWVRLSGCGVAIPHWPVIEMGDSWTLLPPFSTAGWTDMHAAFDRHQSKLQMRIERGELSPANRGRQPRDDADFRQMFLTEWSHRFLAALTGLVGLAVICTTLRHGALRKLIGWPMAVAGVLIVAQAVIGGVLVAEGTSTHWLFLHQGNAGLIMALILWSILRLLTPTEESSPRFRTSPRLLVHLTALAMVSVWMQLIGGALVAGSRHLISNDVPLGISEVTSLWNSHRSVAWNILDNAWLHLWLHRWWAGLLAGLCLVLYVTAFRQPTGIRQRLALQVSGTFLALQIILGLANAVLAAPPMISLAHQALGMGLLLSLVLAWHDARYEPIAETVVTAGSTQVPT